MEGSKILFTVLYFFTQSPSEKCKALLNTPYLAFLSILEQRRQYKLGNAVRPIFWVLKLK